MTINTGNESAKSKNCLEKSRLIKTIKTADEYSKQNNKTLVLLRLSHLIFD